MSNRHTNRTKERNRTNLYVAFVHGNTPFKAQMKMQAYEFYKEAQQQRKAKREKNFKKRAA